MPLFLLYYALQLLFEPGSSSNILLLLLLYHYTVLLILAETPCCCRCLVVGSMVWYTIMATTVLYHHHWTYAAACAAMPPLLYKVGLAYRCLFMGTGDPKPRIFFASLHCVATAAVQPPLLYLCVAQAAAPTQLVVCSPALRGALGQL